MKELLERLEAAEYAANISSDKWDLDPESEELENAFDKAYKEESRAMDALINNIVSVTGGKIDKHTARLMIHLKRNELKRLFA